VTASSVKSGALLARGGRLLAVLRGTPKDGKVHVYSPQTGVDYETEVEALLAHPTIQARVIEQHASGGAARDRADELVGRVDRVKKREEKREEMKERLNALSRRET